MTFLSEFQKKSVVSLIKATDALLAHTSEDDDVLLFVGQSANYMYHCAKHYRPTSSIAVELSGRPEFEKLTEVEIDEYVQYLQSIGITQELFDSGKNVILIDYIHTGRSVITFAKILEKAYKLPRKCIQVFGFHDIPDSDLSIFARLRALTFYGELYFANNDTPRTIPQRCLSKGHVCTGGDIRAINDLKLLQNIKDLFVDNSKLFSDFASYWNDSYVAIHEHTKVDLHYTVKVTKYVDNYPTY